MRAAARWWSRPRTAPPPSAIAVALDSGGIRVRDLTLRTPTLDDVFLELTGSHIRPDEGIDDETMEIAK